MVLAGIAAVVVVGTVTLTWLLSEADRAPAAGRAQARLDAIRTGLSAAAGTGGGVALLLAARRQWLSERTQAHTEDAAADIRHDATERRVTDLYTKAVDQLGSAKAPVRLGGLYALERLAQSAPEHRQTIVNVLCAYLRMPFTPPDATQPSAGATGTEGAETAAAASAGDAREELQVRLTAQRILADHLRPGDGPEPAATFWPDTALDLTGATLVDLDLSGCRLGPATFSRAELSGDAWFRHVQFSGDAGFAQTRFSGNAAFRGAQFSGGAGFVGAQFSGSAGFGWAQFSDYASFDDVAVRLDVQEHLLRRWPDGWTVRSPAGEDGRLPLRPGIWGRLVREPAADEAADGTSEGDREPPRVFPSTSG
jgi:hypothetical protein